MFLVDVLPWSWLVFDSCFPSARSIVSMPPLALSIQWGVAIILRISILLDQLMPPLNRGQSHIDGYKHYLEGNKRLGFYVRKYGM